MSALRRSSVLAGLTALALSLAACGSLPRTSPTQPAPPSSAG